MDGGTRYAISRLTGPADLDDVVALEAASFSNPWSREMLARELQNPTVSRVYVMRDTAGSLVAFCACWVVADELHINTLAVTVSERRRGLATLLLRYIFDAAGAEGVRHATLEVRRSNAAALKLYERLGFEVRGIRANYYQNPDEDALVLWSNRLGISAAGSRP
jgi:[ribosomal protein S18]-alanine N-acetyltransferase